MPIMIHTKNELLLAFFYCTDVIYCVLIYYFLIYVFLPSDDFFRPFGDEVYSHKAGDHYKQIKKEAVRKVLFMKGDLQIVLTTGSKTTDFQ